MKRSGLVIFASVCVCLVAARAADATTPIDPAQRNAPFAPGTSAQPEKRTPAVVESLQHKRVRPATVDKKPALVGERRAAIDITETHEKVVREKAVKTPEKLEQPKSRFDQQQAQVSTSGDTTKPPMVAKYQDSLTAASATNMARFPAMSGATSAKINRFIFRKNGGELADAPQRATSTPAAGGSRPVK